MEQNIAERTEEERAQAQRIVDMATALWLQAIKSVPDKPSPAHRIPTYTNEHLDRSLGFRILIERAEGHGMRVVLADDHWLKNHGGYDRRTLR